MNHSEQIDAISKAFVAFQSEITNPANSAVNPHFKSKYAPLSDILSLARPVLTKHGLAVIQEPAGEGDTLTITTRILHDSGQWLELSPLTIPLAQKTAQGVGSSCTYGRRYCLAAVLGISSEDDDDGNAATDNGKSKKSESAKPKAAPKQDDAEQIKKGLAAIHSKAAKSGMSHDAIRELAGVKSLTELTLPELQALYKRIPDAQKGAANG